jgi:hypothetical protein
MWIESTVAQSSVRKMSSDVPTREEIVLLLLHDVEAVRVIQFLETKQANSVSIAKVGKLTKRFPSSL